MTRISGKTSNDGSVSVNVNSGHGEYLLKNPHRAVSIRVGDVFGSAVTVLSAYNARQLAFALEVEADRADKLAESAKPKKLSRIEYLRALPQGTVFSIQPRRGGDRITRVRLAGDLYMTVKTGITWAFGNANTYRDDIDDVEILYTPKGV